MRVTIALVLAWVLVACSHRAPAEATRRTDGSGVASDAIPPGRGARVVVDVSESNRGFAVPSATALESLHRAIEGALSAHQLNQPFARCTLDAELHCGAQPVSLRALASPDTYRGGFAALHRLLRRPAHESPHARGADDPLDPYAVTVLVTDGFQSAPSSVQPGASDEVACASGADPACIGALLRRRVEQGYGVWAVRLWMPFDGRYFAERRLDDAMVARARAHIADLNADPAWNGVHFALGTADTASGAGPIAFTGARALLVFVVSREPSAARAFVADLATRVRTERITARHRDDDVAVSEWAPFEGLLAQFTSATRASSGGAADALVLDRATRTTDALTVPATCTLDARAPLRFTGTLRYGAIPPPAFARVDLAWRTTGAPARAFTAPTEPLSAAPGPLRATATLDCGTLSAGDHVFDLALWGRWTLDDTALADEWFTRESATTSFEMPERVYGLADLARTVLTAGVAREGALDHVSLRVHRD